MARHKTYKTSDGDSLDIDASAGFFRIAWSIASDEGSFGLYVGEHKEQSEKRPPKKKGNWECWMAHHAIKPYADGRDSQGFYFESLKKAKLALSAANEALQGGGGGGGDPWPQWAIRAKEAGWEPPKGWKP